MSRTKATIKCSACGADENINPHLHNWDYQGNYLCCNCLIETLINIINGKQPPPENYAN